jgi:aminoglycoside phosphotransferase (APT) family kinase protein
MDIRPILRTHAPWLRLETLTEIQSGWDSAVYEADGEWIFRFPRRPDVVDWTKAEAALLPELAPRLPAPVPDFEVVVFDTVNFVGYRKLEGEPLAPGTESGSLGAALGSFLSSVHGFPVARAHEIVPRDWWTERRAVLDAFRKRVLPLLEEGERPFGRALLETARAAHFQPALIHGDLAPEHVLHRGSELTGVIDWSDARVGDPAIDVAWALYSVGTSFADALAHAYGIDDVLRQRGLVFHKLGPWHEALYGLDTGRRELVASGLAGIRERLNLTLSN